MNPFSRKYTAYIPSNINLDKLLQGVEFKTNTYRNSPEKIRDRAAFLLSQISMAQINEDRHIDENGYTRLSSTILQNNIKNYKQYMDYFKYNRIIEVDNSYSNFEGREKCKGYKYHSGLGDVLQYSEYHIYDTGFLNSYNKHNRPRRIINQYDYLYKWFKEIEIPLDNVRHMHFYRNRALKYQQQRNLVNRISDPYYFKMRQGRTNRLFTHITEINKKARKEIRIGGMETIEIDLKSSIPFFSLLLFDNDTLVQNETISRILRESNKFILDDIEDNGEGIDRFSYLFSGSYIMLGEYDLFDGSYPDINDYQDMIISPHRDLYRELSQGWNRSLQTNYTRDDAKKQLMKVLNSPSSRASRERNYLDETYPNVMKVFDRLNHRYYFTKTGRTKRKLHYNVDCPFAYFSQKLESYFILDVVCKRISEEYPECPLYTIHDGIGTIPDFETEIKEIISEESIRLFGKSVLTDTKRNRSSLIHRRKTLALAAAN